VALDGTYNGLLASVADWLMRVGDAVVADAAPDFVTLAEADMKRRLRRKHVRATVTFNAESFPLPADCAVLSSARLVTASPTLDKPLERLTASQLALSRANFIAPGRPVKGAVIDRSLILVPVPDSAYQAEIVYLQSFTPLSATNQSNNILTEAPDAYLFGALYQAAPYLERDERIDMWKTKFDAAIDQLNSQREEEEVAGADVKPMRPPRQF
jgi:hypothetical protein